MTNHPNRRRGYAANNPNPEVILAARKGAGLTQNEAAELVYATLGSWQRWEQGANRMHPALWELWRIKTMLRQPSAEHATESADYEKGFAAAIRYVTSVYDK